MAYKHILRGIAVVLLLLAFGKLMLVAKSGGNLQGPDPVLGFMARGELLLFASVLEVVVGMVLLAPINLLVQATVLASFSTAVLAYRLFLIGITKQFACSCFGRLGYYIGLSNTSESALSLLILAVSTVVSYRILLSRNNTRNGGVTEFAASPAAIK